MVQRSRRSEAVASPLALLGEVEPAHRAITGEMSRVAVGGAHYQALDRAREALARLAAELGHEGRFSRAAPAATGH